MTSGLEDKLHQGEAESGDAEESKTFYSKLKILKFDDNSIIWYRNFSSGRTQFVHIEGQDSQVEGVKCASLIWLIFTIDLPAFIIRLWKVELERIR